MFIYNLHLNSKLKRPEEMGLDWSSMGLEF
jgi:hypothetical protein